MAAVKITRLESVAIAVTLVVLSLMIGFYLGRSTLNTTVVEATPEPSEALETVDPSSVEDSAVEEPDLSQISPDPVQKTGRLDLNQATLSELEALPGIGTVLAQRILDYRQQVGGFSTVEELKNVEGIGDKKFEAIENLIEVGRYNENSGG